MKSGVQQALKEDRLTTLINELILSLDVAILMFFKGLIVYKLRMYVIVEVIVHHLILGGRAGTI